MALIISLSLNLLLLGSAVSDLPMCNNEAECPVTGAALVQAKQSQKLDSETQMPRAPIPHSELSMLAEDNTAGPYRAFSPYACVWSRDKEKCKKTMASRRAAIDPFDTYACLGTGRRRRRFSWKDQKYYKKCKDEISARRKKIEAEREELRLKKLYEKEKEAPGPDKTYPFEFYSFEAWKTCHETTKTRNSHLAEAKRYLELAEKARAKAAGAIAKLAKSTCPGCNEDKKSTTKCMTWMEKGYCKSKKWSKYMKKNCCATCQLVV